MNCPICFSRSISRQTELYDDRYGYPGFFELSECSYCGHKTLEADLSAEELSRLYTEYYPRHSFDENNFKPHNEVSGFKAWFDGSRRSAFRWVPKNVRVLDIGCGFGEALGYHQSRGCDVYGVEVDENIQRVADKFGFKIHVGQFEPDMYDNDFFDYVTMDQVIEHVKDPLETIRGIARVMKPDGRAILSTPNANGWGAKVFGKKWINWHAPYHLQFFSTKSMKIAAEKAGLLLERIETITSSGWINYQWIHLVTCPEMGAPSGFWSTKGWLKPYQGSAVTVLSLFHKTKINHILTRIFDAVNIGDNYVAILRKPA